MSRKSAVLATPIDVVSFDRVIVSIVLILAGLFAFSVEQGKASLLFTAQQLLEVAPFLIGSIGIAAYARASGADNLLARAFRGRAAVMVVLAALMGALSPFCSCGVIPLIAALLAMGVPLSAVMAFWLASPLMDPAKFVLASGILGTEFAIAQTVAAIGLGLLGGFGMVAWQARRPIANPLRAGIGDGGCAGASLRAPGPVAWRFWQEGPRRSAFLNSAATNSFFLGKWLALAFLLESLMLAYIPAETVANLLGGGDWFTVLAAALVGIPAYLNGYAAMPLVAGLIEQGMAPGAGLAFLVAGGVTSLPAAIAVFALARLPVFIAYLGFALAGSVLAGLTYGLFV